jgi:hypothetical protein
LSRWFLVALLGGCTVQSFCSAGFADARFAIVQMLSLVATAATDRQHRQRGYKDSPGLFNYFVISGCYMIAGAAAAALQKCK